MNSTIQSKSAIMELILSDMNNKKEFSETTEYFKIKNFSDKGLSDEEIMDAILSDIVNKKMPSETARYLTTKTFSDHIRSALSWKKHGENFKKILAMDVAEYKSFVIFAARNLGEPECDNEIFAFFSNENESVETRVAAMYHLVGVAYGKPEEREQYLAFCETNSEAVENEARRFYEERDVDSDEKILDQIVDRLHDEKYYNNRFLYLNNMNFIRDPMVMKKAAKVARMYVDDGDDIVEKTALKIIEKVN